MYALLLYAWRLMATHRCLLLDMKNQMKRIVRAIEAIPLHLTLDIIRLDDAMNESWALPLQACRTWDVCCLLRMLRRVFDRWSRFISTLTIDTQLFCDILRNVVYVNSTPGLVRIASNQFVITMATTGMKLKSENWATCIKSGLHIEQSMLMTKLTSSRKEELGCPFPGCTGVLWEHPGPGHYSKSW